MTSVVDICNFALGHIGNRTINSLTETSNEARRCNQFFELARDTTLRALDWNFASRTQALALIDGASSLEWDYVYARPSNCLLIRRVFNEGSVDNPTLDEFEEFRVEGQTAIGCDVETAYCKFTRIITDPNDFDASFNEALSYKLAMLLSKPLTGDMKLRKEMEDAYIKMISEAGKQNGLNRRIKQKKTSSYIDAR